MFCQSGEHYKLNEELVSMIEELEKGNEPILLKLVSNTATPDEKNKWAEENNISSNDINNILSVLENSFKTGTELAKNIEADISLQNEEIEKLTGQVNKLETPEKEQILEKLNSIIDTLDDIKIQVDDLIAQLI